MKKERRVVKLRAAWLEKLPRPGYNASLCPACGGNSEVQKTGTNISGQLMRYRVCKVCGYRFKTVELLFVEDKVALNFRRQDQEEAAE